MAEARDDVVVVTLRLRSDLVKELDEFARRAKTSRSELIRGCLPSVDQIREARAP